MIGLDTSVVVRYLVGTPPEEARRAAALIDGNDVLGLSLVALIETAHVLRTQYGVERRDVVATLIDLVTRENVTTLELAKPDVLEALVLARAFEGSPIPDALIVVASRNAGASPLYTFDRRMTLMGAAISLP